MAFTPAEESRLRVLLGNDNALNTLAQNEPAIIQELGAQDVTIDELQIAASIIDSDKLLGRFGGEDKVATVTAIRAAILGNFMHQLKYGCPLIGMRVDWPLQQMPQEIWPDCKMEFIPYIAQAFDGVKFPLLKQLHPSGVLPADMRGEFPRGWDNRRGVDSGREIMSYQASLLQSHSHVAVRTGRSGSYRLTKLSSLMFDANPSSEVSGEMTIKATGNYPGGSSGSYGGDNASQSVYFDFNDGSLGHETRPRSIAWNMIVRAA